MTDDDIDDGGSVVGYEVLVAFHEDYRPESLGVFKTFRLAAEKRDEAFFEWEGPNVDEIYIREIYLVG